MHASQLVAITAVSLACLAAAPAEARCKREPMPVLLDTVVVTPNGSYTLAEWNAKQDAKRQLAATSTVYFQPVVVTPDYEIESEPKQQYAHQSVRGGSSVKVSSAPASPLQPSLINFLRRLFQ